MKKLHLVSLGCAKNLVDSEVMLAVLEKDGYHVVNDPAEADLLLINTCGFIRPAVEEAVDEILRLAEFKQENPDQLLIVTGCLVQRYGGSLQKELPEVDLFVGTDGCEEIDILVEQARSGIKVPRIVSPSRYLMSSMSPRRLSTPPFRAYLKITEGCDNRCSYCLIPSIRGGMRSRSVKDLVLEACHLAELGVRELTLIAQDLTAYGNDMGTDLVHLLKAILAETDIPWLRLLYLYPATTSDSLLRLMASQPRIVPYLDIPFQHVSTQVLQRMNRRYDQALLHNLIDRIRGSLPHCALRTTMLVGFPGETEADIDLLLDCLQQWQLDHVGVFQYQDEEESAAYQFSGKVSPREQERRYKRVMHLQADISKKKLQQYVGKQEPVIVEGLSAETDLLLEGRTRYQAPDIDGCVYITDGKASPGDIVLVDITEAHTYDLVGGIIDRT